MKLTTLEIAMLTEGIPFGGTTAWTQALGGSETAFSYMARELARRGHRVTCFTLAQTSEVASYSKPDGSTVSVAYYPLASLGEFVGVFEWDVFIVSRFAYWLDRQFRSRFNVLWNHDILKDANSIMGNIWKTDLIMNVSQFHVDQYLEHAPELRNVLVATRNGVDLSEIDDAIEGVKRSKAPKFLYTSRPERGLEVLVKVLWPQILKRYPDATLQVCGYNALTAQNIPDEYRQWHDTFMDAIKDTPGLVWLGTLKKSDLYKTMAESTALLYPSSFPEVSFLGGLESQACRLPIITTRDFALNETIGSDWALVRTGDGYIERFLAKLDELMTNDVLYRRQQRDGRLHVEKNYQWKDVAQEWEERFINAFETRYQANKPAIMRRLMFNSDYILAREWSEREGITEIQPELDAVTIGGVEKYVPTPQEIHDQEATWDENARWVAVAKWIEKWGAKSFLDVGSGAGSLLAHVSAKFPDLKCTGVDFSPEYVAMAQDFVARHSPNHANVTVVQGHAEEGWQPSEKFDVVFAGEILEHMFDYRSFLNKIESWVNPGGHVIITCPNGAVESLSYQKNGGLWKGTRLHIRHFEFRDMLELFGQKDSFTLAIVPMFISHIDSTLISVWVATYQVTGKPFGEINWYRKVVTARPYQRISACVIVKDEENDIGRLLSSIRPIVDQLIVADTGSDDDTVRIAEKYADEILHVTPDPDGDGLGDFSFWRNESAKPAVGEWILWADADERLYNAPKLRRYLDGPIFSGFVVHQVHLAIDAKFEPDVPVRVFRNHKGYAWVGCVHEHIENGMDTPLHPVLILPDVKLAHYGYWTERDRRFKAQYRNAALLEKDMRKNPTRRLTRVLWQRDSLNAVEWDIEAGQGAMTQKGAEYCRRVVQVHFQQFSDPKDLYYKLSFELYQRALRYLGTHGYTLPGGSAPFEIALALAASPVGVQNADAIRPYRRWFSHKQELLDFMAAQGGELLSVLSNPQI